MKKIKCEECGKDIEKKSHKHKVCVECRKILKSKRDKKYREKHRGKLLNYFKKYYEDNTIIVGKPKRACSICGYEFVSSSNHQKYCQDCRTLSQKMFRAKYNGKNNKRLSINYYKNVEKNRAIALRNHYRKTTNPKTRLRLIKSGATKRGLEFNISLEWYLENGWKKKCYYCGGDTQDGLDRIDNSVGYIENNLVPCCINCNRAKATITQKDFLLMCVSVVKNLKLI
jgi:hypothetical protein